MPNKKRLKRKNREDAEVLFFHMPKTGGTALTRIFIDEPLFWSMSHVQLRQARKMVSPETWERAWKVGMLRNPYDRIVSAWYHFVSGRKYTKTPSPLEGHILGFENWVQTGAPEMRPFFLSAKGLYCDHRTGEHAVERIFKIEELDTALVEIAARLRAKVPSNARHGDSRHRPKVDWRLYYHKQATRRRVEGWCAWEFEMGGYEKI